MIEPATSALVTSKPPLPPASGEKSSTNAKAVCNQEKQLQIPRKKGLPAAVLGSRELTQARAALDALKNFGSVTKRGTFFGKPVLDRPVCIP